ncbi:DUF3168 domain-containing protein [Jeotgalibacillus proteolyticus]|uniref:DUF3168 domain-containing protein n=1 Tax=Jeotgalibacillus proteolyticus TaxID=2082395 RepID=A0A2S5GAI1_9BACL|nr:DUF3168 domain-containing protein [Jeotgalibacillus proteolyticus]PPA70037.1 DUF3168 domain-containing protein [Jeotgalibacillus proteolyticus]
MPIQTALWPVQVALFQRLSNDPVLSSIVTGVFDYVPDEQSKPYVRIGEPLSDPFSNKTSYGEEVSTVIHTWSSAMGKKQSYDIINAAIKALYAQPLSLDGGFSIVKMDEPRTQVFDDIDGKTNHGVIRLKFWIK